MSIDKTDGCQVFLSKDSLTAEIITAKSSEMNICIPKGNAGDFVSDHSSSLLIVFLFIAHCCLLLQSEHALPEQFKSVWNGKRFVTECSEV